MGWWETTAKTVLEKGDVTAVLKWVQKRDEQKIRRTFESTLAVRKLSPQAKTLADMYFFETLVRIHRVAEGAGYTGLKPAGKLLCAPAEEKEEKSMRENTTG